MARQSPAPSTPAAAPQLRMGAIEWGLLLLLAVIWGGSFLCGRIAVLELPTFVVVWVRVLLAATVLLAYVLVTGGTLPAKAKDWGAYLLMGLLNNIIPFSLIFWAQKEIGAGLASVLNATTPLFTLMLAHVLTADEKLQARKLAGVLLGIGGVAILMGPEALAHAGASSLAEIAVLGAALSYGFAGIWGRRFRGQPPVTSACCQLLCSSLVLAPVVLLLDRPWELPFPSGRVIVALLVLAVLCTAVAYVIFFTIVKRAGATNVMLVTLLIPPCAIAMGFVALGEHLTSGEILGAAVIGLGLLVIDGRLLGMGAPGTPPGKPLGVK